MTISTLKRKCECTNLQDVNREELLTDLKTIGFSGIVFADPEVTDYKIYSFQDYKSGLIVDVVMGHGKYWFLI